jgi:dGTPase
MDELKGEYGGFIHELYSLRVVDHLVGYGKGLNLTYAVRDGIVTHCGEKFEQSISPDFSEKELDRLEARDRYPATWEGAVVRMADKIAYLGRDVEDAVQLKIISKEEIPASAARILGTTNSEIISSLVTDVISVSPQIGAIGFSDDVYRAMRELKEFNYQKIYSNPILADYHRYFDRILRTLHSYLREIFGMYGFDPEAYRRERNLLAVRFGDYAAKMQPFYDEFDGSYDNLTFDYIAGMTDDYALECVSEITIPKKMEEQFDQFLLGS